MIRFGRLFLLLFACFLILGCASLPEPDSANQTLVVGMVSVQHINRTVTRGVRIILTEDSGTRTHALTSGTDGLFYSTRIPPGIYRVIRLEVPRPEGGNPVLYRWGNAPRIVIENGRVNNLGRINAAWSGRANESWTSTLRAYP